MTDLNSVASILFDSGGPSTNKNVSDLARELEQETSHSPANTPSPMAVMSTVRSPARVGQEMTASIHRKMPPGTTTTVTHGSLPLASTNRASVVSAGQSSLPRTGGAPVRVPSVQTVTPGRPLGATTINTVVPPPGYSTTGRTVRPGTAVAAPQATPRSTQEQAQQATRNFLNQLNNWKSKLPLDQQKEITDLVNAFTSRRLPGPQFKAKIKEVIARTKQNRPARPAVQTGHPMHQKHTTHHVEKRQKTGDEGYEVEVGKAKAKALSASSNMPGIQLQSERQNLSMPSVRPIQRADLKPGKLLERGAVEQRVQKIAKRRGLKVNPKVYEFVALATEERVKNIVQKLARIAKVRRQNHTGLAGYTVMAKDVTGEMKAVMTKNKEAFDSLTEQQKKMEKKDKETLANSGSKQGNSAGGSSVSPEVLNNWIHQMRNLRGLIQQGRQLNAHQAAQYHSLTMHLRAHRQGILSQTSQRDSSGAQAGSSRPGGVTVESVLSPSSSGGENKNAITLSDFEFFLRRDPYSRRTTAFIETISAKRMLSAERSNFHARIYAARAAQANRTLGMSS